MYVFSEVPLMEESNYSPSKLLPDPWVLWQPDVTSAVFRVQSVSTTTSNTCGLEHLSLSRFTVLGRALCCRLPNDLRMLHCPKGVVLR